MDLFSGDVTKNELCLKVSTRRSQTSPWKDCYVTVGSISKVLGQVFANVSVDN